MATYKGTSLGYIRSETQTKASNLFNTPLPGSDSDQVIVLDLFGMTRTISISGVITGALATLQTFIATMEGYANGQQTIGVFVSNIHATNKNCYIQNFSYTYSTESPSILNYTLDLIEASA